MSPDRRSVLKGLGVGGALAAGGLVGWRLLDDSDGEAAPEYSTTSIGPRPPEAASSLRDALSAVGGRYLEEHPDEADQATLLAALPALDGQVPEHPGQGLRLLADQAVADHVSGDVLSLDGWLLSRTECRAAALYAV